MPDIENKSNVPAFEFREKIRLPEMEALNYRIMSHMMQPGKSLQNVGWMRLNPMSEMKHIQLYSVVFIGQYAVDLITKPTNFLILQLVM